MFAPTRLEQSGLLRRIGGALLAGAQLAVASPAAADGGIRLNEILLNPLGADRGQEFIEIMAQLELAPPKMIEEALPANLRCGKTGGREIHGA